jgi:type II secretory pathway predicted ATPase ExeA
MEEAWGQTMAEDEAGVGGRTTRDGAPRASLLDPLGAPPDVAGYFPREATDVALVRAAAAVREPAGRAVLVGGPGVGKSLLLCVLMERLADDFAVVCLPSAGLTPELLSAWMLTRLGEEGADEPTRDLATHLEAWRATGQGVVLLLDDVQELEVETAAFLAERVEDAGGALRVALSFARGSGAEPILEVLGGPPLRVDIDEPWTETEGRAFLMDRLARAGAPESMRHIFAGPIVFDLVNFAFGRPASLLRSASGMGCSAISSQMRINRSSPPASSIFASP